jgi:hypothetical protein
VGVVDQSVRRGQNQNPDAGSMNSHLCHKTQSWASHESDGSTMKTIRLLLIIIAAMCCLCTAHSEKGDPPTASAPVPAIKGGSGILVCSISVQKLQWKKPEPVEVAVVIGNRSESELNVPVVPSFTLKGVAAAAKPASSELRYLAFWDLRKGATLPLSTTVPLQLNRGDSKSITSDIADLLWSRMNWSVLPIPSSLRLSLPEGTHCIWS